MRFALGGFYIMLMPLLQALKKGKMISLTLVFEKAGRIEITVPVLSVGALGPNNKRDIQFFSKGKLMHEKIADRTYK